MILSNKKLIIFDMDGVLFLSTHSHEIAFKSICQKYSLPNFIYTEISGMRTDEAFLHIFNKNKMIYTPELVQLMTIEKREIAAHLLRENPIFAENCYNIIKNLSEKYILSLASSSDQKNVHYFLNTSRTKEFFKVIISGNEVSKCKPDPEIFNKILYTLSISPQESLVIEDSIKGIEAAKSAKICAIGIANDEFMRTNLMHAGAFNVFLSVNEFYENLSKGN
ncbi:HAD family hydrolase [Fluviispira multicolorata]|uniref:HAD-IA family hydrolase n=1 Tax=Fluviispira multicolorata TaxID=2654512 RepID=A0A833JAD7_9BACT|nr:HAD family phosphatase [Fluviispira multicolorata]KAB8027994.1 HAD-IA family hydrolase [Fluviispira multicolorata]